jgi:GGDEF domain-containing protein
LGGDEFGILLVECDDHEVQGLCERLETAFSQRGITVSTGVAHRDFGGGLAAAIERADAAMYERKFGRLPSP